jgi:tripartite ATP-independent transporter DctM subunit
MTSLILVFGAFIVLVVIGVPVAVSLGLAALAGMLLEGLNPVNVVAQAYRGLDSFTLLAVPFFLTLGFLVTRTSLTDRLLDLSRALVGRVQGALGYINVVVSMLFAGLSGSATADTSGIGAVLIPMMDKRGYSRAYAAAITAATSTMGLIIPPSILMIIYAATSNTSVGALFLAGFAPGLLIGGVFLFINFLYVRRHGVDKYEEVGEFETPRNVLQTVGRGLPALLIPVFIIVGITGGVFTATEAGAVALAYTLVLTILIYRDIKVRQLGSVFRDAVLLYGLPLIAVATATPFGWMLTLLGAQDVVRDIIASFDLTPFTFMVLIIVVFAVIGTFLDGIPAIIIFVPLFLPGAAALDIHPIHLGIVITMVLAMGLVTPPYGLCLLIANKLARSRMSSVIPAMVPFVLAELIIILLVAFYPDVALFVPRLVAPELF